jgi:hypothetical protein
METWTTGKSMSVSATTLSRLVKTFSAVTARISTIWPSVYPASRTIGAGDVAALAHGLGGELDGGVGLGVARRALAVLRQVEAEITVRPEAVVPVAAVDLGDGQPDSLAGLHVERLRERGVVGREALERGPP